MLHLALDRDRVAAVVDVLEAADHAHAVVAARVVLDRGGDGERALAGLNPVFRTAVVLRDLEELSYEEIADVLDVSLGTVKSRILRGRESLRRALMEQLEPERGLQFTPQTAE